MADTFDEKEDHPPGLEPVEQKMDLSGLDAVPLKKTLLMVNSFALNTTAFLNKFASLCESKLTKLSGDIQRVEIVLALLEAKLNSIPWLESAPPPTAPSVGGPPPPPSDAVNGGPPPAPSAAGAPAAGAPPAAPPPGAPPAAAAAAAPPGPPPPPGAAAAAPPIPPPGGAPDPNAGALVPVEQPEETGQMSLADDPRYKSYFKMLKLGVMKEQVQQRMMMNGDDPSILDNPGAAAPAPPAAGAAAEEESDDEDDEFQSD